MHHLSGTIVINLNNKKKKKKERQQSILAASESKIVAQFEKVVRKMRRKMKIKYFSNDTNFQKVYF